jgi:hypothetical protein
MRTPNIKVTRDTISYAIGVLGTIYETVIAEGDPGDRLPFLVIFVGLITAPAFLHRDDRSRSASTTSVARGEEEADSEP